MYHQSYEDETEGFEVYKLYSLEGNDTNRITGRYYNPNKPTTGTAGLQAKFHAQRGESAIYPLDKWAIICQLIGGKLPSSVRRELKDHPLFKNKRK